MISSDTDVCVRVVSRNEQTNSIHTTVQISRRASKPVYFVVRVELEGLAVIDVYIFLDTMLRKGSP